MSSNEEKLGYNHDAIISCLSTEEYFEYDNMCVVDQAIYLTSRDKGGCHQKAKADIYSTWC